MKFGIPFSPMLLKEVEKPFDNENFLYEMKFDGYRATIHVNQNSINIFSRNKRNITSLYPELINIKNSIKEDCIFDGEIVLFKKNRPNFMKLQERSHLKEKIKIEKVSMESPVCFIVFDILYKKKDLTNKTLLERKKILETIPDSEYMIKTKYILKEGKKLFKKIQKNNLEGIVAKRIKSIYMPNLRTDDWIKIKNIKDEVFLIGGFINDSKLPTIRLVLGEYRNNQFCFVGKVTVGKKNPIFKKLQRQEQKKETPFFDLDEKEIIYLNPKIKVEVSYLERTKNNHLRHPEFKR